MSGGTLSVSPIRVVLQLFSLQNRHPLLEVAEFAVGGHVAVVTVGVAARFFNDVV